jgi:hypothetical protein
MRTSSKNDGGSWKAKEGEEKWWEMPKQTGMTHRDVSYKANNDTIKDEKRTVDMSSKRRSFENGSKSLSRAASTNIVDPERELRARRA